MFWNLPDSFLRRQAMGFVRPVAYATGLDQNWAVFAPNPRSITLDLYAEVELSDGTTMTWHPPDDAEPIVSPWRVYRWRKWVENVRADANPQLWEPAARWIAEEVAAGRDVVEVRLIRRWYDVAAPGTPVQTPTWNEYEFFTLDVTS